MKEVRFQEAVRSLSGPELADLVGCLGRDMTENGITGELLGLCLVECVRRQRKEKGTANLANLANEEGGTAKTLSAPREDYLQ